LFKLVNLGGSVRFVNSRSEYCNFPSYVLAVTHWMYNLHLKPSSLFFFDRSVPVSLASPSRTIQTSSHSIHCLQFPFVSSRIPVSSMSVGLRWRIETQSIILLTLHSVPYTLVCSYGKYGVKFLQ